MEEIFKMSSKEIDRLNILKQVEQKKIKQAKAAEMLDISERQIRKTGQA